MLPPEELTYLMAFFPASEHHRVRYDCTVKDDNGYYHVVWFEGRERCIPAQATFAPETTS